jgi:hypothetical protein
MISKFRIYESTDMKNGRAHVEASLTRCLSRLLGVFLLVTAASEWTQPGLTVAAPAMVDQPALFQDAHNNHPRRDTTAAAGLPQTLQHPVWAATMDLK